MQDKLEFTRQHIERHIKDTKSKAELLHILIAIGVNYEDLSEEYGYTNIRIYAEDGYIRIYSRAKKFYVDVFRKYELKASGIPTFMPSGKNTMKEVL